MIGCLSWITRKPLSSGWSEWDRVLHCLSDALVYPPIRWNRNVHRSLRYHLGLYWTGGRDAIQSQRSRLVLSWLENWRMRDQGGGRAGSDLSISTSGAWSMYTIHSISCGSGWMATNILSHCANYNGSRSCWRRFPVWRHYLLGTRNHVDRSDCLSTWFLLDSGLENDCWAGRQVLISNRFRRSQDTFNERV